MRMFPCICGNFIHVFTSTAFLFLEWDLIKAIIFLYTGFHLFLATLSLSSKRALKVSILAVFSVSVLAINLGVEIMVTRCDSSIDLLYESLSVTGCFKGASNLFDTSEKRSRKNISTFEHASASFRSNQWGSEHVCRALVNWAKNFLVCKLKRLCLRVEQYDCSRRNNNISFSCSWRSVLATERHYGGRWYVVFLWSARFGLVF